MKQLEKNINAAMNKTLQPLEIDMENTDSSYCLFDKFHENNTVKEEEILRRTRYVSGLSINTQVQEQFFSQQTRKNYFLNYMSPSKHLFIMRQMFDDWNIDHCDRNAKRLEAIIGRKAHLTTTGVLSVKKGGIATDDKRKSTEKPFNDTYLSKSPKTDEQHQSKAAVVDQETRVLQSSESGKENQMDKASQKRPYVCTDEEIIEKPKISRSSVIQSGENLFNQAQKLLTEIIRQANSLTDCGRMKMLLVDIAQGIISNFLELNTTSQRSFVHNLSYIKNVLGFYPDNEDISRQIFTDLSERESVMFQRQGIWPVCGICVLNNAIQENMFGFELLSQTADDLWMIQITGHGLSLSDDIQRQRGSYGDFSFDVLSEAAKRKSFDLINLRASVFQYAFSSENDLLKQVDDYFNTPGIISSFVIKLGLSEHYVAIVKKFNSFFLLDSSKKEPSFLSPIQVVTFIRNELRHTMCGVYGIQKESTVFQYLTEDSSTGCIDTDQNVIETTDERQSTASTHDSDNQSPPSTPGIYSNANPSDNDSNQRITIDEDYEKPNDKIAPMISLHTVHGGVLNIDDEHLICLNEKEYINNFIMDFVSEELMRVSPTLYILETVFSACMDAKTTYNINDDKYRSCDVCLIPFHVQQHWILFVINKPLGKWTMYDSLNTSELSYEHIKLYIENALPEVQNYTWFVENRLGSFKQRDAYNCGLHVILVMMLYSLNTELNLVPSPSLLATTIYPMRSLLLKYIYTFDLSDGKFSSIIRFRRFNLTNLSVKIIKAFSVF